MYKLLKLACIGKECVACGCCVAVCPRSAVRIVSGVTARIDNERCIGCGKCGKACPANVITLVKREATE